MLAGFVCRSRVCRSRFGRGIFLTVRRAGGRVLGRACMGVRMSAGGLVAAAVLVQYFRFFP